MIQKDRSFLVIGDSVAGLALCGALAQQGEGVTVRLIPTRRSQSRRLVSGCSLRSGALSLMAKSIRCSVQTLAEDLGGTSGAFFGVSFGTATCKNGKVSFDPPVAIQRTQSSLGPIGISTRHLRILECMKTELLRFSNVEIADFDARSASFEGTTFCAEPDNSFTNQKYQKAVAAVQVPCRPNAQGLRFPLAKGHAYAPLIFFPDGVYLSFFTPFFDPLTPDASWYGISTKIVDSGSSHEEKELHTGYVRDRLHLMAESLGLQFVDEKQTLAGAVVPIPPRDRRWTPGAMNNVYHGFDSGAPAIAADGMFAMATGATAYAEAFAAGIDAVGAVRTSLRPIRARNFLCQTLMTRVPVPLVRTLMKICPGVLASQLRLGWEPNEGFRAFT